MAVQIEQSAERAPSRNRQKAEPEHLVDKVKVVVQALAAVTANEGATGLLVVPRLVGRTRLHGREDVDQSRTVPPHCQDLLDAVFFAEGLHALDVLDLHPFLVRQLFGASADGIAERQRELLGVIEQADIPAIELGGHRLGICHARQRPLEHQPVEERQDADDLFAMTLDQVRHRPTIPPPVHTGSPSWFRLRRGRKSHVSVTPYRGEGMAGALRVSRDVRGIRSANMTSISIDEAEPG